MLIELPRLNKSKLNLVPKEKPCNSSTVLEKYEQRVMSYSFSDAASRSVL